MGMDKTDKPNKNIVRTVVFYPGNGFGNLILEILLYYMKRLGRGSDNLYLPLIITTGC